jgi:hypothetical protein
VGCREGCVCEDCVCHMHASSYVMGGGMCGTCVVWGLKMWCVVFSSVTFVCVVHDCGRGVGG